MGLLNSLLKKGKTEDSTAEEGQVVQTFEPAPATAAETSAEAAAGTEGEKSGKHGDPGVCCGSCH